MVQIPLIGGVVSNNEAEFTQSPPVNLEPVALESGLSKGQYRVAAGVKDFLTGPGIDRGAICQNGRHFRVMGTSLVEITDVVTVLGDVGGSGPVSIDYSFDRLAVRSSTNLFYYDGTLTQVTDADLGECIDMVWVGGYFMSTDGRSLIVTELNNPLQIDALKYGSAEEDPDPVTGLMELRNEVYAFNRYTTEVFQNVGSQGFPFAKLRGATIPYGCVSANAKCYFSSSIAFVGSARNEALGVYLVGPGTAAKLSNRELDRRLAAIPDPTVIELETRTYLDESRLFIHLPNETWVYLLGASRYLETPVWYICRSGDGKQYRLRHAIEDKGKFYCGDTETAKLGELDTTIGNHFGEAAMWLFDTSFLGNMGKGFLINMLELTGLPGRGDNQKIFMSMTFDGQIWTKEHMIDGGDAGRTSKRLVWWPSVHCPNYVGFKFRGFGMTGFARLDAELEALTV